MIILIKIIIILIIIISFIVLKQYKTFIQTNKGKPERLVVYLAASGKNLLTRPLKVDVTLQLKFYLAMVRYSIL